MVGRHGSEAIRDTTFLRNSRSSTLASEGSFLVALANACRMFARLTMPTSLPPSTMGTRLIRLCSSKPAISPSGVSGLAVTTLRVITSATLPEWDLMYSLAPSSRYQLKPPGMPSGRADLWAPQQIAFAHNADQLAFLVDNGRRTDVIVRNHFRVGTGLAIQDRHSGRPVHAGRLDRPARAHCGAGLGAADRQTVCGREPARRGPASRGECRREGCARWPHAADGNELRHGGQSDSL